MFPKREKFLLLLWKDWLMQWNHKPNLLVELFLPLIFVALLVYVRTLVEPESVGATIYEDKFTLENLDYTRRRIRIREMADAALNDPGDSFVLSLNSLLAGVSLSLAGGFQQMSRVKKPIQYHLAYSPDNPIFDAIVKGAARKLGLTYSGHKDSSALEEVLLESNIFAGVEFSDSAAVLKDYPEHLNFKLRFPSELRTPLQEYIFSWMTIRLFFELDPVGPRWPKHSDGGPVCYISEGFLAVQHAISTSFVQLASKDKLPKLPRVYARRFPYPPYVHDILLVAMGPMMVLILLLSYIYPATYMVKCITSEKEKQLKEVMKIMGLDSWIHWVAWFTRSFIMMGTSGFLITLVMTYEWENKVAVLTHSSFTAVYFYFLTYIVNTIFFCFMMATLFSKANTAAAATGLVWILTYVPYVFIQRNYTLVGLSTKLFWSLCSNTAMGLSMGVIANKELQGVGLQWSNMFDRASIDDSLSLGHLYIIMIISSTIFMLIALYMEQVFPGDYGVPQSWDFPFKRSYWAGPAYPLSAFPSRDPSNIHRDKFAAKGRRETVGVRIVRLYKTFGNKTVVNNLTLDLYQDETTVLLGHNGAGKTTTIMIVIGMIKPSSGTVYVNGCDIRTDMEGVRMSLGICPQHNILFDDLTVREHLIFYSRLKGFRGAELDEEVDKFIKKIGLENKANIISSKLSGGMKRKLSVCCAFCGGSKVVICDEPSSGMDPAGRRQLWDFIQSEKRGRTIFLTTHFMDEAEVLGDQIAIMRAGKVECSGTLFYLKKRYGEGYKLICEKKETCDSVQVTKLLSKYIPGITPNFEVGLELSYILPEQYSGEFEVMLQDLENNLEDLNLNGYGISLTSLEEIFLKTGAEKADEDEGHENMDTVSLASDKVFAEHHELKRGFELWLSQWHSMIFKKYVYTVNNKLLLLLQNIIPITLVAFAIVAVTLTVPSYPTPRLISLVHYPQTVTLFEETDDVTTDSTEHIIAENYKALIRSYSSSHTLKLTGNKGVITYLLQLGRLHQSAIDTQYIVAATFDKNEITAWFNNEPLHSAPLSVSMIDNAIAKMAGSNIKISVTNKPLEYSAQMAIQQLGEFENIGVQISLNVSFCLSFVTAMYSLFMVMEYELRAKLLQFVAGVRALTFWFSHIVWDLFTFTITVIVLNITLFIFNEDGYGTLEELSRYTVVMYVFGIASLPCVYLLSKLFTDPVVGFSRLTVLFFFTGNALYFVTLVMSHKLLTLKSKADILKKQFMILPHFCLTLGIMDTFRNNRLHAVCEPLMHIPDVVRCQLLPDCCKLYPYFGWHEPGVLAPLVYLVCTGIISFLIVIAIEYRLLSILLKIFEKVRKKEKPMRRKSTRDDDVEHEKAKVSNMTYDQVEAENLVVDQLTKYYGRFLAVNQISFIVSRAQCFGLLGVNGAGKTSTFKMLTGDVSISAGEAYVRGISVRKNMHIVYRKIGYCPQFDALFNSFTGSEMLKMFCLLHGISTEKIPRLSESVAEIFGFKRHLYKKTGEYSGGSKRKLSAALAIVGNPEVIYLDEPTTGMDPAARRNFWNVICRIRDSGKSIILTTHSMEECEALCTRLAIMVNGEFKCIGSIQHLKNKFSQGLIVKIKLKEETYTNKSSFEDLSMKVESKIDIDNVNVRSLTEFLKEHFPETYLRDRHRRVLTYYVPIFGVKWSGVFGLLEKNKHELNIEDYTISQTTLEEIFLQLVMYPDLPEEEEEETEAEPVKYEV